MTGILMCDIFLQTIYTAENYGPIKMEDFPLIKKRTGDNYETNNKTVECYLKAQMILLHCNFLPMEIN